MKNLGARVYGLAAIHMGIAGLIWGDFAVDWIPAPAALPGRMALAYLVGVLLVTGGVLINWQRTAVWGAALLTALFAAGLILLDLTRLAVHLREFDYWDASSEQFAVTAAGLIAWMSLAKMSPQLSSQLQYACRIVFGLCLFVFGAAHFVYLDFTASLVPKWLPPNQMFWAWFTAIAAIAAGLAIVSGVLALWAARLLTAMYILFGLLVHLPLLIADPAKHRNWVENGVNLALIGAAWIVADSLAARRRAPSS